MSFRKILKGLLTVAIAGYAANATAQNTPAAYPSQPIRFVVPYAAGANGDIVSRILAEDLQKRLGKPVVVENRPGAGGNIGAAEVKRAPADGYTIMLGTNTHAINMTLYPDANYDLAKDFKPISMISSAPSVLLVNPALPVTTLAEFVALAKSKPGTLNYSSGGSGSSSHLNMELILWRAGIRLQHVPYNGAAAGLLDLIAGRVQASINGVASSGEMIQSGKVRPLAVLATERSPIIPNVPTFKEAGLDGLEQGGWQGILMPAATPDAIVAKLNQAIAAALVDPQTKAKFDAVGSTAASSTTQEFAKIIDDEVGRYRDLIKAANIKLE